MDKYVLVPKHYPTRKDLLYSSLTSETVSATHPSLFIPGVRGSGTQWLGKCRDRTARIKQLANRKLRVYVKNRTLVMQTEASLKCLCCPGSSLSRVPNVSGSDVIIRLCTNSRPSKATHRTSCPLLQRKRPPTWSRYTRDRREFECTDKFLCLASYCRVLVSVEKQKNWNCKLTYTWI